MTLLDDDEAAIKALNLDRLPTHIVDKRVTELMDLTGKKAFVTGAGGDGLGHAIANRLAGSGADIALVGRTLEPLERRGREIAERWNVNTIPVQADMSDWDQIHRAVREAHDKLGGLDIMINNPVMVAAGPFEKQSKEEIAVNPFRTRLFVSANTPDDSGWHHAVHRFRKWLRTTLAAHGEHGDGLTR